jgi:hypothetical protein
LLSTPAASLSLPAANKRPNTIKSYLEAVEQLDAFLAARGMPRDVANIRREHVESFQAEPTRPTPTRQRSEPLPIAPIVAPHRDGLSRAASPH